MKVQVRFKGFPTSASLVEYTTRKIHHHLSRFGARVGGIDVRLSDVNGPRGGRDKRCLLMASGPGIGSVRVEELHEDFYAGVDQALGRLAQAVGRSIERSRTYHVEERRAS